MRIQAIYIYIYISTDTCRYDIYHRASVSVILAMVLVRQSLRTKPPFGELDDPPLRTDSEIICEEEYIQKEIHYPPYDVDFKEKKRERTHQRSTPLDPVQSFPDKSIPKIEIPDKNKLSYTDFIERLITGNDLSFLNKR
jgi:hypothetical protein